MSASIATPRRSPGSTRRRHISHCCGATSNGLIGTHLIPACIDHGIPEVRAAGLLAVGAIPIFLPTSRNPFGMIGAVDWDAWDERYLREQISANPLVKDRERADAKRPFRLACIQLATYDGTIYNVRKVLDGLAKRFPPDLAYSVFFDTTVFVNATVRDTRGREIAGACGQLAAVE